jgi:hypothetical protein
VARRASAIRPAADAQALALAEARKALVLALVEAEPRPLLGTASSPGFFSGTTQTVKDAAELCLQRGWLEPTGEASGSGKTARPLYRLTSAGMREAVSRIGPAGKDMLRTLLDQLDRTLQGIQAGLAPLRAALEPVGVAAPSVPVPVSSPGAPLAALTRERLRQVLREQYGYLRQLVEYEDGIVPLPRLYDKTREVLPGLGVAAFHDELQALWNERRIELHILNEVHRAEKPELGIRRKDALYYYVFWKDRA